MILNHDKIAIVGYADTGKTRCSELFVDREVFHADDYIDRESVLFRELQQSTDVRRYLVEGVKALWFLRNGLNVDLVVYLEPKFEAKPKHRIQRKAIDTVWRQWLAQKPGCRIMVMNEDILEFIIEHEKFLQIPSMIYPSQP